MAEPGERSLFIDRAVQHYVDARGDEALRARLERAAIRDRDIDRGVAVDWLAVDQEAWQGLDKPKQHRKATRSGAKSISLRSIRPSEGESERLGRPSSSKTTFRTD